MTLTLKHSIEREIAYLSIGQRKTLQRIQAFQNKYGVQLSAETQDIPALDKVEWEGGEITLRKLQEKIQSLNMHQTFP